MAAKSPALDHFREYRQTGKEGKYKVPCKHCDMVIAVTGKTTSNLLTHLKVSSTSMHTDKYDTILSTTHYMYIIVEQVLLL